MSNYDYNDGYGNSYSDDSSNSYNNSYSAPKRTKRKTSGKMTRTNANSQIALNVEDFTSVEEINNLIKSSNNIEEIDALHVFREAFKVHQTMVKHRKQCNPYNRDYAVNSLRWIGGNVRINPVSTGVTIFCASLVISALTFITVGILFGSKNNPVQLQNFQRMDYLKR
ncbi:MAG: hypothetical protein F6J98_01990 [Moorea sp. SIO4G2]|nr:hypothetical protein [Moorena sp. SIO4G2]